MFKDPIPPLFIGKQRLTLPSCHSTNQVATDLLSAGKASNGMVVITDWQRAGRGQRGNVWESMPKMNLTISVILEPRFLPVNRQFDLTVIASLAIVRTLQDVGLAGSAIKWPNDIYCKGGKIAGVLIENSLRSGNLETTVMGIGLNVNQEVFQAPKATSIKLQLGIELGLGDVLNILLAHLNEMYHVLSRGGHLTLRKAYLDQLLWLEEPRTFQNALTKSLFNGSIQGVDQQGRLIIDGNGSLKTFDFKEIIFVQ